MNKKYIRIKLIVMLVLCSVTFFASVAFAQASELVTDIGEKTFKVGVPTEFSFATVANDDAGVMVRGTSIFSDPDAIEKLEYYEVNDQTWYELIEDFGPSTGFPMMNMSAKFRVTFKTAGEYSFTAEMYKVDGGDTLCSTEVAFTVQDKSKLTTDIGEKTFKVGVPTEFSFTTVANGDAGVMVRGTSIFNNPEAIEKLEYYEVNNGQWYELTEDFGPSTGFPMMDMSAKFRVTFKTAGNYTFTANMYKVDGGDTLCSTEVAFTVQDKSKLTTDIGEKTFKVGVPTEFSFTTVANGDAGVMVRGTSIFNNPEAIEKLEYYEVNNGQWYELTEDFGPSTGFPMMDMSAKFRVTFKTAGNYTFTANMYKVDGGDIVCGVEVAFTVRAQTSSGGSGGGSSSVTKYEIKVIAGKGGTISPKTKKVEKGEDQKFTIKADEGYQIEDVIVDGESIGVVSSYRFKNVKSKHTIKATFERIPEVEDTEEPKDIEESDNIEEPEDIKETENTEDKQEPVVWENTFSDIKQDAWYYNAVGFVKEKGLFSGISKDEFGPKVEMTRGMFVTVLGRLKGENVTGKLDFKDVDKNAYYASSVAWASEKGIVNGVGNGNFAPNKSITREELAVMMYNYMIKERIDIAASLVEFPAYNDEVDISPWAQSAVRAMRSTGLMGGRPGNNFDPKGIATRAEVATILMKFCK